MKTLPALAAVSLAVGLAACSSPSDNHQTQSTDDSVSTPDITDNQENTESSEDEHSDEEDSTNSDNDSSNTETTPDNEDTTDSESESDDTSDTDSAIDSEQKQMALDTLNELVEAGKEGKVYRLTDQFYIGKTTQTDVYNTIGQPERQDTFDRYTGSMGRASYDLRYNKKGLLVEARYLGTNVERQTNLGGITTADLTEQLGQPDTKRQLAETKQTNYIYKFDPYQIQFVLNEKDTVDHVNLLSN